MKKILAFASKTLVNLLTEQAQSLKLQYIEKTAEWARKNYKTSLDMTKWDDERWCKFFGLEPRMVQYCGNEQRLSFPKGFYNSKASRTYDNMRKENKSIVLMGLDEYIADSKIKAEIHYKQSIEKLAIRIEEKGLDMNNITLNTTHVGINIETWIKDGNKSVRAWTIIAQGEIQCPHYRYLIK